MPAVSMGTAVAPGGRPPKTIASVTMGPIMIAPDVQSLYETIDDKLYGDAFSFHFKTNVRKLHCNQLKLLKSEVASLIVPGCYIGVYGLADRTGSQQVNYEVSGDRLTKFYYDLEMATGPSQSLNPPYADYNFYGEDYSESQGAKDEVSSFYARCVTIFIWPNYQSRERIFKDLPFIQYVRANGGLP